MFKKIASNTISQILAKIWTAIISIFLISILTNYLSVELYWTYSKVYNYLWIFAFLADLGLYTIAIREINLDKSRSKAIIWNIMTLRLILWIFIIFLSLLIAYFLPWYNNDMTLIAIFIVWIFTVFWLMNSSFLALMQSYMKVEFSLFSSVLWKLINFILICIIVFILFPKNIIDDFFIPFEFIILAWLIGIIVNTILNYYYANKIVKIWFLFDFSYIKKLLRMSFFYGIALFLSVVYFKIDIILLSVLLPSDISDIHVALYSVPMKIIEVLMLIWVFFLNSLLPSMTNYFKLWKLNLLKSIIDKWFKVLFLSWVWIISLFSVFSTNIIKIVSNSDYVDKSIYTFTSDDVFIIVLFVLLFNFIASIYNYILIVSEKQKELLKINLLVTIFNIIWNILLIPKYSFIWAAFVTVLSQIILLILVYIFTRSIIKIDFDLFFIIKTLLFGLLLFLFWIFLLSNYSFWLYFDTFIYWTILFLSYLFFSYKIIKK